MTVLLPLLAQSTQRTLVIGVLVLMFIAAVAAVLVFGVSLWKQRQYNSTTLPSLEVEVEAGEPTEEPGSAFALADLEEPISKDAYATRLDDFSLDSLPELKGVKYEPEEVGLPSLESIPAPTTPTSEVESALVENVDGESDEEDWSDSHEYHSSLPPHEAPVSYEPSLPAHEPTLQEDPVVTPVEPTPAPVLPPPVEETPVEETPLVAEYSSFRDGEWRMPEVEPTGVENETFPAMALPEQAYPSFMAASEEAAEETESDSVSAPPAQAEEPRRGFRKLRMPIGKMDNVAEEEAQETVAETEAGYPGRRRLDVPTDS